MKPPTHLNNTHVIVPSVEDRLVVYIVDNVLVSGVEEIIPDEVCALNAKFETFSDHTEETSSGSTTTHSDNSLPEYESFLFEIEPDQGELTSVVMEDILGEPRVHMPNIFDRGDKSLGKSNPRGFLSSGDIFSISFIRNPLYPVIETLLPFSSENEDQVFNPGILSSNLLSHLGKITSDFSESLMMIYGGDIPILDVPYLHFYPP
ncbi:hypothetical protein Tco_0974729 [Tanacetum coccineum]|uniref:Uncharacterized protein n=1 Tax=Tanacetum coccineum TaxID=301880 RepID=A0ABQ5ECJ4_9ASTR